MLNFFDMKCFDAFHMNIFRPHGLLQGLIEFLAKYCYMFTDQKHDFHKTCNTV